MMVEVCCGRLFGLIVRTKRRVIHNVKILKMSRIILIDLDSTDFIVIN